ncbi:MAG: hypothetical protein ABI217_06935 [Chthoniobacterales bacterium]
MPGDASAICTLFEGDYHIALAAFINSLHTHGYRGSVWVGYRGPLPPWARGVVAHDGVSGFEAAAGLTVNFVLVETKRDLTNFKPDFLIDARRRFFPDAKSVFYFDTDIVLKCAWPFFEEWTSYGVALCEDINSPMPSTHPLRARWRRFYTPSGFSVARDLDVFLNGGFVGVTGADWEFVETWKRLLDLAEAAMDTLPEIRDRRHLFDKQDQDTLNLAAMFCTRPVSIAGKDGMDIVPGGFLMSHALGDSKTWRKNFLGEALRGYPPTSADRQFFQHTRGPLRAFSPATDRWKRLNLSAACAVARFYSRH